MKKNSPPLLLLSLPHAICLIGISAIGSYNVGRRFRSSSSSSWQSLLSPLSLSSPLSLMFSEEEADVKEEKAKNGTPFLPFVYHDSNDKENLSSLFPTKLIQQQQEQSRRDSQQQQEKEDAAAEHDDLLHHDEYLSSPSLQSSPSSPSSSSSSSLMTMKFQPLPSSLLQSSHKKKKKKEFDDDDASSDEEDRRRCRQRESAESIIKRTEMLVHPAMLTINHDDDESELVVVVLMTNQTKNYTQTLVEEVKKYEPSLEDLFVIDDTLNKESELLKKLSNEVYGVDVVLIQEPDNTEWKTSSSSSSSSSASSFNANFDAWYKLLERRNGILAIQLHSYSNLLSRANQLQQAGFKRIINYSVSTRPVRGRRTYSDSINYLMAFTTPDGIAEFHQNEAFWNLRIHDRLNMPLKYVDSSTMMQIEYPSKRSAMLYCAAGLDTKNQDCSQYSSGFDASKPNVANDQLQVTKSSAGENAGRGIYALVDIPHPDTYISLARCIHQVRVPWQTTSIIQDLLEQSPIYAKLESLYSYIDGYGFIDETWGEEQYAVDTDIMLFANHGCNGTYNVGWISEFTEQVSNITEILLNKSRYWFDDYAIIYNPMEERRINNGESTTVTNTIKPIKAGDEIFENYLAFDSWDNIKRAILELKFQCNGGSGFIELYQNHHNGVEANHHIKFEDAFVDFELDDSSPDDENDDGVDAMTAK